MSTSKLDFSKGVHSCFTKELYGICTVDKCTDKSKKFGLCEKHLITNFVGDVDEEILVLKPMNENRERSVFRSGMRMKKKRTNKQQSSCENSKNITN